MVNYCCEKCGKEFSQKGHYTKHLNNKYPCIVESKVKKILDKEVDEKELTIKINNENSIDVQNIDGMNYLKNIENNTIDLILTDPPYIIYRQSGINTHYNKVKDNQKNNYGYWDNDFTIETLEKIIKLYFDKLRNGGTLIIFFDLWKIETLKKILDKYNFKQIRFIEWIKTNPQPLNSKINYLTNCREIALTCIKGTKPTFNSEYDKAIYMFPIQGGKNKFHPTQKSLPLFEELIKKHSNENDTVLDTFLGSGTTLFACKNTNRKFKGCEINKEYFDKITDILNAL